MDTKKLRQKILDLAIRGKLVSHTSDPRGKKISELLGSSDISFFVAQIPQISRIFALLFWWFGKECLSLQHINTTNATLVWETYTSDLPVLKNQITQYIEALKKV